MTTVKPHVKCIDYWPVHIPDICLAAYKVMIDHKQIKRHRVIFNQMRGSTIVEYESTIPHDWILQELRETAAAMID